MRLDDPVQNVYLDHAATTPLRAEALEAMTPFFSQIFGNPSSVHGIGAMPREALDRAHAGVAEALGCRPGEVVFTGGGTEADNLAVLGAARALRQRGNHVVTSQIEHHAVLNACRRLEREGFRVTYLPVDREGFVDLGELDRALTPDTVLATIILANNEIGTIQPIAEISRLVRSRGVVLHTDAVQAAGIVPLDVGTLNVDLLSISAHKCYGPKGVGALYVRRGTPLEPIVFGGEQERGRRSGTENVPGVVGLAVAFILAEQERDVESLRLRGLRDRLINAAVAIPGVHLTGPEPWAVEQRLAGHASFYLDGITGEAVLVNLDRAGIACASGSACRAGSTEPSHVLTAIGLPPALARNGLRMTLGRDTSDKDIEYVLETLPRALNLTGRQTSVSV